MDDLANLTDKHMNPICKRMSNLKQISMWSSVRRLTGFSFKQMHLLTKLTTIKFDSNKSLNDEVETYSQTISFARLFLLASSFTLSIMYGNLSYFNN